MFNLYQFNNHIIIYKYILLGLVLPIAQVFLLYSKMFIIKLIFIIYNLYFKLNIYMLNKIK